IVGTMNLVRSRVGRAFIAIRDQDIAAEIIGLQIFRYKLLAFAISSFYAGVPGVLYTYFLRISMENFGDLIFSRQIVLNLIPNLRLMLFGVLIIVFLIVEPDGLNRLWRNIRSYFRIWPFAY